MNNARNKNATGPSGAVAFAVAAARCGSVPAKQIDHRFGFAVAGMIQAKQHKAAFDGEKQREMSVEVRTGKRGDGAGDRDRTGDIQLGKLAFYR